MLRLYPFSVIAFRGDAAFAEARLSETPNQLTYHHKLVRKGPATIGQPVYLPPVTVAGGQDGAPSVWGFIGLGFRAQSRPLKDIFGFCGYVGV